MKKILTLLYIFILNAAPALTAVATPSTLLIEGKTSAEAQNNPASNDAGIDIPNPQFSWTADPSTTQVSYQLIIADSSVDIISGSGSTWDSGKVTTSDEFCNYPSTGPTLLSNKKYYWGVRTWDVVGSTSDYTSPESFEMNHFIRQQTINMGYSKQRAGIAFGDINGDGLDDYIEAEYGSYFVTAYINTGTGTFKYHWKSAAENSSEAMALADIDSDNDLDLLVANCLGAADTNIYKNNGSGIFTLFDTLSTDANAESIAAGDIDRDGDIDFIEGYWGTDNYVFINDGNGNFTLSELTNSLNDNTRDVILADVNGDSYLDLIVGNQEAAEALSPQAPYTEIQQESTLVFFNNQNGGFNTTPAWQSHTVGPGDKTYALTLADFNQDGFWDLITGNLGEANRYYQNDGDGTFTSVGSTAKTDNTKSLSSGDIDNDGDLDYVEGNDDVYDRIYTNDGGTYNLSYISFEQGIIVNKLILNDFNGDGAMDLFRALCDNTDQDHYFIHYSTISNAGPTPPSADFASTYSTATAKLKLNWGDGSDVLTNSNQLAYNIRFGTATGCYNMISGAIGSTDISGSFWGNIGRSTYVYLSISPKTYFWQIQAIDTSKSTGPWSAEQIVNTPPIGGWDSNNVLLSTCAVQWTTSRIRNPANNDIISSRRGLIDINFRAKDLESNQSLLTGFEYSTATAGQWHTLPDTSTYLTLAPYSTIPPEGAINVWPDNDGINFNTIHTTAPFNTATDYKFTWKTNILSELAGIQCDQTRVRFKLFDIYNSTSSLVVCSTFTVDNLSPTIPGMLSDSNAFNKEQYTVNFDTSIPAVDNNFSEYIIYYRANNATVGHENVVHDNEWTYTDDINLSSATFGGASSTTITGLTPDTTYYMKLYAYDAFGNFSSTEALKIKTNDPPAITTSEFGVSKITATQRTDGSNLVDITFYGIDRDEENSNYIFSQCYYKIGSSTYVVTPSTSDANFTNNGGAISLDKSVSTFTFVWYAGANLTDYYATNMQVALTITDGRDSAITEYTNAFTVDTSTPQASNLLGIAATSTSIDWTWTPTTNPDVSFTKYEIWYSTDAYYAINRDTACAGYVTMTDIVQNSTTTEGLSPFLDYYACIWSYDSFGHESRTSTAVYKTGYAPACAINQQPEPLKDGTGKVLMVVDVGDLDQNTCTLEVEFSTNSKVSWRPAKVSEISRTIAPFQSPVNNEIKGILTNPSTNTITFTWDSKSDIDNVYLTDVYLRVTPKDTTYGNTEESTSFIIDNSQPKFYFTLNKSQYNHIGSSITLHFEGEDTEPQILLTTQTVTSRFRIYDDWHEPAEYINLSGSTVTTAANYLYFNLTDQQRNQIARWDKEKRWNGFEKEPFLRILSSATRDNYGNYSIEESTIYFTGGNYISWVQDITSPLIVSATYTVVSGDIKLSLQFNEYMDLLDLTTTTISGISIQDSSQTTSNYQFLDYTCSFSTANSDITTLDIQIPYGVHDLIWNWSSLSLYLTISSNTISDLSGNAINAIYDNNAFWVNTHVSTKAPNVTAAAPDPDGYNIARASLITVSFDDFLKPLVGSSIDVRQTVDPEGTPCNYEIQGSTNYDKQTSILTFTPTHGLPGNSIIQITIDKDYIRNFGNVPMPNDYTWSFKTQLRNDDSNKLVSPSGNIIVSIPKNQLPAHGRVEFTEAIPPNNPQRTPLAKIATANTAEESWENDYHYQFDDLTTELLFFNLDGSAVSTEFTESAELSINYSSCLFNDDPEYLQYGNKPPVKVKTLKMYYLNENLNRWIPLNSTIDEDTQTISASIRHFSIYSVMGDQNYDLEDAHPYPVPYKPTAEVEDGGIPTQFLNTNRAGITFTKLPSECDIEIFTIAGRRVNIFKHSDSNLQLNGQVGNYYWYPVENSYGFEVVSGVYIYYITSGNNNKMGKLMIIR
jgi:hypothetical protein